MGFSPLTLDYSADYVDKKGILHTPLCKGVFVSGYEAYFSSQWNTNEFTQGAVIETIIRPQGKGYQQDMQFSLDYERNKILEEQLELQQLRFLFDK